MQRCCSFLRERGERFADLTPCCLPPPPARSRSLPADPTPSSCRDVLVDTRGRLGPSCRPAGSCGLTHSVREKEDEAQPAERWGFQHGLTIPQILQDLQSPFWLFSGVELRATMLSRQMLAAERPP